MTDLECLNQLQDSLIAQKNLIDNTLEMVEKWLINAESFQNHFSRAWRLKMFNDQDNNPADPEQAGW